MVTAGLKVIIGLGKTGLSCARFFSKNNIPFAVTDSRKLPPFLADFKQQFPAANCDFGSISEQLLQQAEEIILSPGISLAEPAVKKQLDKGKSVVGDIEIFSRYCDKPIIAITGTNGKTTVTVLLGEMLKNAGYKVAVCGNVGEPVLERLHDEKVDIYIVELSSFQLEATHSLRTKAASILNISEDHLDRHGTLENYVCTKQRIFTNCGQAVINLDDPITWRNVTFDRQPITFGLSESADYSIVIENQKKYLAKNNRPIFLMDQMKLKGQHHVLNALAALALAQSVAAPLQPLLETLKTFGGVKHRCQWVRQIDNVNYYNDSKATNVGATLAALKTLAPQSPKGIILIAGGQGKGADFSVMQPMISRDVKYLILIGEDADKLRQIFKESTQITLAKDLHQAILIAKNHAQAGDVVLLSPACASFDMFENFEQRGEYFVKVVKGL